MELGAIFLWISFISVIIGIGFSILFFRTKKNKYKTYAKDSSYLAIFFLLLSFVMFVYYCMTANSNIFYSYYYSMPSYEWYYKLSAVWAGRTGSVFFWIVIIATSFGLTEYIYSKKDSQTKELTDYSRPITLIILFFFLVIILNSRPFIDTATELLAKATQNPNIPSNIPITRLKTIWPSGVGMNSQLISPWMVIHPPILFIGYASFTIPLSISFVYLITGRKDWIKITEIWTRVGWLFLTLGIAIGAVWAYVTLGWGGYWAWDPVESASLLPWLSGTAFLHLQIKYKKTGEYEYLTHAFIFITFALLIFATLTTRGGIAVGGTHAYPGTLPILKNLMYWILMAAPILVGGPLLWKRYKINENTT